MIQPGRGKKIFEAHLKKLLEQSHFIVDIGTSQRFAKELRPYENWFEGKTYKAGGYEPEMIYGSYNCDLHTDIEALPFEDDSVDAVICLEVIEHVKNPFKASVELYRILKPGGILLLTTPFLLGYHGKSQTRTQGNNHSHNTYPDYWRYTHEGLQYLFKDFKEVQLEVLNGPVETGLMVFNLFFLFRFGVFRRLLDRIDRPRVGSQTSRHLAYCIK